MKNRIMRKDANVEFYYRENSCVIGYGSQGHAQAQNLRDSVGKCSVGF